MQAQENYEHAREKEDNKREEGGERKHVTQIKARKDSAKERNEFCVPSVSYLLKTIQ